MYSKFKELFKSNAQKEAEQQAAAEAAAKLEEEKAAKALERKAKREAKQASKELSPKEIATKNGEPWVNILSIDVDPQDLGQGAFELDWNDIFVARLIKSGYQGKTDQDIVDNWFKTVCRNVLVETYEQLQADPDQRAQQQPVQRRDIGGGKAEFS